MAPLPGDRVGRRSDYGVEAVAFSGDGRLIATSATHFRSPLRSRVTIWDVERQDVVQRVPTHGGASAIAFDPSGSSLAVGTFDGLVEIWDVQTGESVARFPAHASIGDMVYSPDGARIATSGEDGTVRLFDARNGEQLLVLRGDGFLVSGVAFSPDGTRLASASPDGVVRVWALDLDDLIRIARTQVTRELSGDECRQYLHLERGCS